MAAKDNPGLVLGAAIGAAGLNGRDKITFVISPAIETFADWVEQLIAESTGKEGKGLLPVAGEGAARSRGLWAGPALRTNQAGVRCRRGHGEVRSKRWKRPGIR